MKISDHPYYIGVVSQVDTKIENTAEAIANYIIEFGWDHNFVEILTLDFDEVLSTRTIWVDWCADKDFLIELNKVLIPKQKELMDKLGVVEFSAHDIKVLDN